MNRKKPKGLAIQGGGGAASDMSVSNGGKEVRVNKRDTLLHQLENLEIGVEYKLELKAEDLEVISELGSGNGGTVSKVIHKATKTVMARKVNIPYIRNLLLTYKSEYILFFPSNLEVSSLILFLHLPVLAFPLFCNLSINLSARPVQSRNQALIRLLY